MSSRPSHLSGVSMLAVVALAASLLVVLPGVSEAAPCDTPTNEIVAENCLPGNPASEWDVSGAGDPSIQGFTTDISVDQGGTVEFKVDTDATDYRLDIYRMGYYGGDGARLVDTVEPSATLPQAQPACLEDSEVGLVDCGNWGVSASWAVPADATSGIHFAKLVREDGTSGASHVVFIVRDDDGNSDLLFQTSDTTWQAYNQYGGYSLYSGSTSYPSGRASKVSYNRPFTVGGTERWDWVFNAEYPMVRWLERNGYDVSYFTDIDTDRLGSELLEHDAFLSVGHDEYWSAAQRANVEAARDAGVHQAFFSGNEIYWKVRWENSTDGSDTPFRTLVTYKEGTDGGSSCGSDCDPEPGVWTGLWRSGCDIAPDEDGCAPENALSGQISWTNDTCGGTACGIEVPAEYADMRLWRDTPIAALSPGESYTFPEGTLGYEWDFNQPTYAASNPPGLVRMSETTVDGKTHQVSLYRADSGALVFGAGTVQWSWGLDANHTDGPFPGRGPADATMQQATVNLFADMGVQPATLQTDLTAATATADVTAATSTITSPNDGDTVSAGTVTITGTATDSDGTVGVVEVSTDGGTTWHRATGRESWTYEWTAPSDAGERTILSRATDDSGNIESPGPGVTVTVGSGSGGGGGAQPAVVDCAAQTTLPTASDPILVVTESRDTDAPYGCYLTEILRGEGLVEFQQTELSALEAAADAAGYLGSYDVVLLDAATLTPGTETALDNYVNSGGNLIAMRPDADLAGLFGVTHDGARTEQISQFLAVDTASGPGSGIYDGSMNYHGASDAYSLDGATALVHFWDDISTPSTAPAVTLNDAGSGQAAAFAFDLATSITLMRQGNPAWQDTEGDGVGGYRPSDMFRRSSGEDWNAKDRLPVPQADEQQRFLANLVLSMTDQPLPRMWYLPGDNRSLIVNTGDAEGLSGADLEPVMDDAASYGGFFTHYLREPGISGTTVSQEAAWRAAGHETGVHAHGTDSDYASMESAYGSIVTALVDKFGHGSRSARNHTIDWVGWSEMAEIEADAGTGLDTNYYHIPYYWSDPFANGYFTGSGLPQRFSDENGTLLGIYQALTEWPDEWFDNNGITANQAADAVIAMIDAAENDGWYSAFVNNLHPVRYNSSGDITSGWANQVWSYAQANGIPMWSAEMLLDFVEARNGASFDGLSWNGTTLSYDYSTTAGGHDLTQMLPTSDPTGGELLSVALDGTGVSYTTATIKGREYALFTTTADTAAVTAEYGEDTVAPTISNVRAESITDTTATIKWDTDELASSEVAYGTDPGALTSTASASGTTTTHSVDLTGLSPDTTYHYEVTSVDASGNSTTAPAEQFTTTLPSWTETTVEDFSDGTTTDVKIVSDGDGALQLDGTTFADDFTGTSLDSNEWLARNWSDPSGPTDVTVADSSVTVSSTTYIRSERTFLQKTLEGRVELTDGANAHFGWATAIQGGDDGIEDPHWAMFTAKNGSMQARTRLNDGQGDSGGQIDTVLSGVELGVPHDFKIVWTDTSIEFWVDDVLKTTHTRSFTEDMRIYLSAATSPQTASADLVEVSGTYSTSGTYESSVFNAGGTANFDALTWTGSEPSATTVGFETRSSTDGVTWLSWEPLGTGGAIVSADGQFLQYRASLTSDGSATPQIDEVSVTYDAGADTTPPAVSSSDPTDGATDVPVDTNITLNYAEPIDPATFDATISGGVTHTTAFLNGDRQVVLDPDSDLAQGQAVTVTVAAGVEDTSGNATTSAYEFGFTTSTASFVETTIADFADGTFTDTETVDIGDGAVALAAQSGDTQLFSDSFDGAASGWTPLDGTWQVVDGTYDFDIASSYAASIITGESPTSFTIESRQKIISWGSIGSGGYIWNVQDPAGGEQWKNGSYMLQWDTRSGTSTNVRVFRWDSPTSLTLLGEADLADVVADTWYDLKLVVDGSDFEVFVDDVSVVTASDSTYGAGALGLVGWTNGDTRYDDVVLTENGGVIYPTSGTYVSSVLDAVQAADWGTLDWDAIAPTDTGLQVSVRTGSTATPDTNWSDWSAVSNGADVAATSQYLQYRAELTTTDPSVTPSLEEVRLEYTAAACSPDAYEPNDEQSQAYALTDGETANGEICPGGDEDWFSIEAEAGETIVADLTFAHADGDLNLYLHDSSGTLVDSSESTTDNESVSVDVSSAGAYLIKTVGGGGDTSAYSLTASAGGLSRFEETDGMLGFGSGWFGQSHSSFSGGTARSTKAVGSTVEITFTGTAVRLVGLRAPNRGTAEISIDGVSQGSIDTHSSSYEFQSVFEQYNLADQTHTMTVTFTGSGASTAPTVYFTIDAIEAEGP